MTTSNAEAEVDPGQEVPGGLTLDPKEPCCCSPVLLTECSRPSTRSRSALCAVCGLSALIIRFTGPQHSWMGMPGLD